MVLHLIIAICKGELFKSEIIELIPSHAIELPKIRKIVTKLRAGKVIECLIEGKQ